MADINAIVILGFMAHRLGKYAAKRIERSQYWCFPRKKWRVVRQHSRIHTLANVAPGVSGESNGSSSSGTSDNDLSPVDHNLVGFGTVDLSSINESPVLSPPGFSPVVKSPHRYYFDPDPLRSTERDK